MKLRIIVSLILSVSFYLTVCGQPDITISSGTTVLTSGLGSVEIGDVYTNYPATYYFLIENSGDADLILDATTPLAITGPDAGSFSSSADLAGTVLAPGDKVIFDINVVATSALASFKSMFAIINSNDPDEPAFSINVNALVFDQPDPCEMVSGDVEHSYIGSFFQGFLSITGITEYAAPSGWQPGFNSILGALFGGTVNIGITADAHGGSNALELFSDAGGAGDLLGAIACDAESATLKGYYKFSGAPTDQGIIVVSTGGGVEANRTDANSDTLYITTNASVYTQFEIPIPHDANSIDSLLVYFAITNNAGGVSFKIDDLELVTSLGSVPSKPAPATLSNGIATSVLVNWVAPNNNGSPITSYTLQQKTGAEGTFTDVFNGLNYSHLAGGLAIGTTYYFRVKATNTAGDSEYSDETAYTALAVPVAIGGVDLTFNPDDIGNGYGDGANQRVSCISIQQDGKIVIGGFFDSFNGASRMRIVRVNSNGDQDQSFDPETGANNALEDIAIQTNGKIVIGGRFTTVNGVSRNYIARLNSDGSLDTSFDPGTGADYDVKSIVIQPDGKILIGGFFSNYNGVSRNGIARLNADGSLDTSFDPGTGASGIFALRMLSDEKIVIGGPFTTYNGTARNRLARINSNGSLDATFDPGSGPSLSPEVIAIQPDGKLIIGGPFVSYNGTPRNNIARLTSSGSLDATFDPGLGPAGVLTSANAIEILSNGKMIVVGRFTSFNGVGANNIIRLNSDGSVDGAIDFSSGADHSSYLQSPSLNDVALQTDGKLIIGGFFNFYNEAPRNNITRINGDGSNDNSFMRATAANGTIHAISIQPDNKIILSGRFTGYFGNSRSGVVRIEADGNLDNTFNPGSGADGTILTTAVQSDGKIIIGGEFTSFNGTNRNFIARTAADGSLDSSFDPGTGPSNFVLAMIIQSDGKIIIGGAFAAYNGVVVNGIACLNDNGSLDNSFNSGTGQNGQIFSMKLQPDGKIIIGGTFTTYNGIGRNRIARLNQDGSLDSGFDPGTGANSNVNTISLQSDGKIIVGGGFNSFNGTQTSHYLVRLNADGSLDNSFNVNTGANNWVYSSAVTMDGKIFIGGFFDSFGGVPRKYIARLDENGDLDTSFDPGTGLNDINTLTFAQQSDGRLLMGGSFTNYNGTGRNRIARIKLSKDNQTISFSALPSKVFGDGNFDLTGAASSGLPVTYLSSNTDVASISGATVTILGAGSAIITASQPGNADYHAATSVDQSLTVSKANQTITFGELLSKMVGEASFDPGASVSSGLAITYESSNTSVATVNSNMISAIGVGVTTITASQPGDSNHNPATSIQQDLTVTIGNQTISFPAISNKTIGDPPFLLSATASSGLSVGYNTSSTLISIEGSQVTLVNAGRALITASQAGNTNYNAAPNVDQSFCINPAKPTITKGPDGESVTLTSSTSAGNQWFKDGTAITGATNNTLTVTAPGIYKVQVTADDCVSEFSSDVALIVTGDIGANQQSTNLIYPNPANEQVTISLDDFESDKPVAIRIMDMQGRVMTKLEAKGKQNTVIDVRSYSKGSYLIIMNQATRVKKIQFIKSEN